MSTGQVASGQMADLEVQYKAAKADYETKESAALSSKTAADAQSAIAAKQKIIDLLHQMIGVTTQMPEPNLEVKRQELLDRLHLLEREYNLLSTSNDKIKTLERIREREEEKFEGPFLVYSGLFILGCMALAGVMIMKGI